MQRLVPLLPGKLADPGPTGFDQRKTAEGILWIARTGAPWRARPPYFGKGNTGHRRFRRWMQNGVFDRLLQALPEDLDWQIVMVDGTLVKIQQHGAGPEKGGRSPAESRQAQAVDRSRGGLTTKLLALTDGRGQLVQFRLRPGNAAAGKERPALLADVPLTATRELLGDLERAG